MLFLQRETTYVTSRVDPIGKVGGGVCGGGGGGGGGCKK